MNAGSITKPSCPQPHTDADAEPKTHDTFSSTTPHQSHAPGHLLSEAPKEESKDPSSKTPSGLPPSPPREAALAWLLSEGTSKGLLTQNDINNIQKTLNTVSEEAFYSFISCAVEAVHWAHPITIDPSPQWGRLAERFATTAHLRKSTPHTLTDAFKMAWGCSLHIYDIDETFNLAILIATDTDPARTLHCVQNIFLETEDHQKFIHLYPCWSILIQLHPEHRERCAQALKEIIAALPHEASAECDASWRLFALTAITQMDITERLSDILSFIKRSDVSVEDTSNIPELLQTLSYINHTVFQKNIVLYSSVNDLKKNIEDTLDEIYGIFIEEQTTEKTALPKDARILVCAQVFDGIGDLRHTLNTVRALVEHKHLEKNQLDIVIKQGRGVAPSAFFDMVAQLRTMVDNVILECHFIREEFITQGYAYTSFRTHAEQYKHRTGRSYDVLLNVSATCHAPYYAHKAYTPFMDIREAGEWEEHNTPFKIMYGIGKNKHLWTQDLSTLKEGPQRLSDETHMRVYGTHERHSTDVNLGYYRRDADKMRWIETRLFSLTSTDSHCPSKDAACFITGKFDPEHEDTHIEQMFQITHKLGWQRLEWVDFHGKVSVFETDEEGNHGTVRVVQSFIPEHEWTALRTHVTGLCGACGDSSISDTLMFHLPGMFTAMHENKKAYLAEFEHRARTMAHEGATSALATWFHMQNSVHDTDIETTPEELGLFLREHEYTLKAEWAHLRELITETHSMESAIPKKVAEAVAYHRTHPL